MKSFVIGCKQFFGLKPGQTLSEFATELRSLTEDDRKEIAAGLTAHYGEEVSHTLASAQ